MSDDGNPIARVITIIWILISLVACKNYIPSYENPFDPESPVYAATTPPTIIGPADGFVFDTGFIVEWKKVGTVADVYRLQVAAENDFRAGSVVLDVELQGVDTFTVPSIAFNGPVYCRLALKLNQNGVVWSTWSIALRLIKLAPAGNRAPTVTLTPPTAASVKGGTNIVFEAIGNDADGDAVIDKWYVAGKEHNIRTAFFTFNTPNLAVDKTYTISVVVSDGIAASALESVDIVVPADFIQMVLVSGGTFQMGASSSYSAERPIHSVTLTSFRISKYEVTQAQYATVTGSSPSHYTGDSSRPVEEVTWYDAVEFCNKFSEREGMTSVYTIDERTPASGYPITFATVTMDRTKIGYRLPTEAEWEYAARGGASSAGYTYSGSNEIDNVAWCWDNSSSLTHPVGLKAPNELGIHDMSGNVLEWVWDWWGNYPDAAQTDPTGASSGPGRVGRGGCLGDQADYIRSADRTYGHPGYSTYDFGFRVLAPAWSGL